ncbi:MAG: response regulator [Desulfosporosinus sp.]|nr:response regulator [Desulfosporosinus sp.]
MSVLKHLKLGTKLTVFLGTILVLLVLSTSFGYVGLTQNSSDFHEFGKIANEEMLAGRIQSNLLECQIAFKNFIELGDDSQQQVFQDHLAMMQKYIEQLSSTEDNQDRAKNVATISTKANEYNEGFKKVVDYKAQRDSLYNSMSIMGPEMEQNLSQIMQAAYDDNDVAAVYGAGNAEENLLLVRLSVMKYLESDDQKSIDSAKTQLSELDKALDIYEKTPSSIKNKELLDLVIKDKTNYANSFSELVAVVENTQSLVKSLNEIGPEISSSAEAITLSITKEQDSYGPKVQKSNSNSIYGMLILSLFAISLVVLISLGILKMVVVPVKTVTNTFKDISEGEADLGVRLKVGSTDELGDMAVYFNKFMEKLQIIMTENKNQSWLKTGQTELNEIIRGDQELRVLGNKIITYLAKYLNAQIGAIYLSTEENILKMMGSYAYTRRKNLSNEIIVGEGLVGQAALERQTIVISNVPDDYLKIHSGTFESVPRNIIVTPCVYNDKVKCVLELGSLQEITDIQQEFIELIGESIAIAIHSMEARSKMHTLLDKTLEQTEELQVQQEELRQSNEELEEQAKALKESEARLQAQQEELRQSNEELEEQARALKESEASLNAQQEELRVINEELEERTKSLELQKNDVSIKNQHLESAQKEIEDKAKDLQVASKYKSEFLANVSHELRTPLNSILVLSQLLANKTDHSPLTDKQLEFAKTIFSSGTDLLKLINDVLDLSKIEAGKMEVNYENMSLEEFLDYVERTFRQIAMDKGLGFTINLDNELPESISTDTQRVQQIINNLVSNAFKFTKEGGVTINVGRPNQADFPKLDIDYGNSISIAISDTGIGIPAEKQLFIFEAFRQSDGTTSREYGGTGLGLSISRELAQLLGGTIALKSEEGKGSTFTLILPAKLDIPKEFEQKQIVAAIEQTGQETEDPAKLIAGTKSDIDSKENGSIINLSDKMLLIIDDDQNFSSILADLAHEKGFTCLTSNDGETGIQLAIKYKPKAVLLDIGLPGISGWEVIEELRNHPETKNIPVHIISGHENTTDERERGIVGYLRKPVSVEKINDLFQRLEGLEEKALKKLLIIASDEFQKTVIAEVIGNKGIAVSTVDTGQEAYNLLKTERFDCIIFDINLSDMSGYELLTKLREEKDQVPIIIYIDKDYITDEEGPLQDYGESIIIKGSRSMERLVAEASLFLHGVDSKITDKRHKVTKKYQDKEASLKDKKVLIVDDDMRNVFALTSALEEKNMTVIVGKNGREGIDRLHQNQDVDLILMDIMMPEMDGYAAMKEIRKEEKFRKIPIIALTAKAMKEDKNKCIEAGANDYLTKPIELDKLISLLRVWLYK